MFLTYNSHCIFNRFHIIGCMTLLVDPLNYEIDQSIYLMSRVEV